MTVHLRGSIPVTVVYDEDLNKVERVIAHDESHEFAPPGTSVRVVPVPGQWHDKEIPLDQEEEVVYQNAADDLEWPAWEWGW